MNAKLDLASCERRYLALLLCLPPATSHTRVREIISSERDGSADS